MKPTSFSALGRAVWDETLSEPLQNPLSAPLSVLSVEPYGMKRSGRLHFRNRSVAFSALGRAVWDETRRALFDWFVAVDFQCSRSSRMG